MRLIGMLDSPYVRRVAISLKAIGIAFDHEALSVFSDYAEFAAINPVVKAPTLIAHDGTVLSDSTLILEYLDRITPPERRLNPSAPANFLAAQRIVGLALIACEKTVQIVYELNLRPAEKQHQPWLDRIAQQLLAAYDLLEAEYANVDDWRFGVGPMQADITCAVAWRFSRSVLPERLQEGRYPALVALSTRAETTEIFVSTPID